MFLIKITRAHIKNASWQLNKRLSPYRLSTSSNNFIDCAENPKFVCYTAGKYAVLINVKILQSLDILISKFLYEMFNFPGIKHKDFHIRWQI